LALAMANDPPSLDGSNHRLTHNCIPFFWLAALSSPGGGADAFSASLFPRLWDSSIFE
jgi:hypothetical protein